MQPCILHKRRNTACQKQCKNIGKKELAIIHDKVSGIIEAVAKGIAESEINSLKIEKNLFNISDDRGMSEKPENLWRMPASYYY